MNVQRISDARDKAVEAIDEMIEELRGVAGAEGLLGFLLAVSGALRIMSPEHSAALLRAMAPVVSEYLPEVAAQAAALKAAVN